MISKDDLPLLAILRGITEKDVQPLIEIFTRHAVKYVEITMNTKNATRLIEQFIERSEGKLIIGAGTVLNNRDMDEAVAAGGRFIVSPSVVKEVVEKCVSKEIPVFPGALTPTEIHSAWNMGATMVKLFPASLFGAQYIRAIKAPLNEIKILAVGGVGTQNISRFFENGADAVAFGAGIVRPKWLEENKYDLIDGHLSTLIENYKNPSADQ